jgi:thiol-disulfide isomerase/thioredoxin
VKPEYARLGETTMHTRLFVALATAIAVLAPIGCGASEAPAPKSTPSSAPAPPTPPAAPNKPDTAKDAGGVKYTGLDGQTFTVAELPGNVKVLNFWATWCAPCIKEIPSFNKLHDKYGSRGVTIVGVSVDEEGKSVVEPFLKTPKGKIGYRVALAKLEDLKPVDVTERIPVTLVYDKAGKLVKRFDGYAEETELEAAIDSAMTASAD